MKRSLFLLAILLILQTGAFAQKKVILDAMKDELTRSMQELKLDGEAGPYYISYFMQDSCVLRITADFGAVTVDSDNRFRTLNVDLRVGNYSQDNSNFISLANVAGLINSAAAANIRIPIDDDYDAIRIQIWQATDRVYKNALETLSRKTAALQNTVQTEVLPDFSKEEAITSLSAENSLDIREEPWRQLVDHLSKLFVNQPGIQRSVVDLSVQISNGYYVNSEGTTGIEPYSATRLVVAASTQADDGMPLQNYRIYTASQPDALPEKAKLENDIKILVSDLLATRDAPVAEEYSGPVLFTGQAAGELFSQGFGNLLVTRRTPVSDSAQTNAMIGRFMENPFENKLNMKVAAKFLSLKATPTLKKYKTKALLGSYGMDEEGVRSSDVSLIENGKLKDLLSSRTPVKGFLKSNGHGRGGSANPSVIQVISTNKETPQQLKQELIDAVNDEGLPFGYIVKGLTPPSDALRDDSDVISSLVASQQGPPEPTQFRLTKPYSVFRVYPDGKEELVRGIEFSTISINAFKDVLATSDEEFVYNYPVSGSSLISSGIGRIISLLGGGGFSPVNATVITPAMLLESIDMRKSAGNYPKLPIVSYPAP